MASRQPKSANDEKHLLLKGDNGATEKVQKSSEDLPEPVPRRNRRVQKRDQLKRWKIKSHRLP
jgi:hypothetical protein